jgi:hypothetical protein
MKTPVVLIIGKEKVLQQKLKARMVGHGFHVTQVKQTSDAVKTFDRDKT